MSSSMIAGALVVLSFVLGFWCASELWAHTFRQRMREIREARRAR